MTLLLKAKKVKFGEEIAVSAAYFLYHNSKQPLILFVNRGRALPYFPDRKRTTRPRRGS